MPVSWWGIRLPMHQGMQQGFFNFTINCWNIIPNIFSQKLLTGTNIYSIIAFSETQKTHPPMLTVLAHLWDGQASIHTHKFNNGMNLDRQKRPLVFYISGCIKSSGFQSVSAKNSMAIFDN